MPASQEQIKCWGADGVDVEETHHEHLRPSDWTSGLSEVVVAVPSGKDGLLVAAVADL